MKLIWCPMTSVLEMGRAFCSWELGSQGAIVKTMVTGPLWPSCHLWKDFFAAETYVQPSSQAWFRSGSLLSASLPSSAGRAPWHVSLTWCEMFERGPQLPAFTSRHPSAHHVRSGGKVTKAEKVFFATTPVPWFQWCPGSRFYRESNENLAFSFFLSSYPYSFFFLIN